MFLLLLYFTTNLISCHYLVSTYLNILYYFKLAFYWQCYHKWLMCYETLNAYMKPPVHSVSEFTSKYEATL